MPAGNYRFVVSESSDLVLSREPLAHIKHFLVEIRSTVLPAMFVSVQAWEKTKSPAMTNGSNEPAV
jgi:hypothetical protein